jgi:hypothetical protein
MEDKHISLLTQALMREIRLYIMAHGSTQDTFCGVLKAIALCHILLFEVDR